MGFLNEMRVYAPLAEDTDYTVVLKGVTERANKNFGVDGQSTKDIKGFVDFEWHRVEDARPIRDGRIYPTGVSILFDQLVTQRPELNTNMPANEFIRTLIEEEVTFVCHVHTNVTETGEYRNIVFTQASRSIPATPQSAAPKAKAPKAKTKTKEEMPALPIA